MRNLRAVSGLYFVRAKSPRLVWNYIKEIGLAAVMRKIISRSGEANRNEKWFSCGIGRVVESDGDSSYSRDQIVSFVLPADAMCAERVVVSDQLVFASTIPEGLQSKLSGEKILHVPCTERQAEKQGAAAIQDLEGWSPYSGARCRASDSTADEVSSILFDETDWSQATILAVDSESEWCEVRPSARKSLGNRRKRGVLFGYGNYAKVVAIPNIKKYIDIKRVHEIDPLQIDYQTDFDWDTSPVWREKANIDVGLFAGYHHTHAPLAMEALRNGIHAVVEKPAVVDQEQLDDLLDALAHTDADYFTCFQKRYSQFNQIALQDMGHRAGEPISYHCIVYEVPLPERHWYRWPNSKSRLVSNGCHWIDHFLFLNDYCDPDEIRLTVTPTGIANCSVSLSNGAFFSMVLTDEGSERVGMQDYIELRCNKTTVKITNTTSYHAEDSSRVIRRKRANKMDCYRDMYREIGRRISVGEPGDSIRSVQITNQLMLDLEKLHADQTRRIRSRTSGDPRSMAS